MSEATQVSPDDHRSEMHIALKKFNNQRLKSYYEDPGLIEEHYGIEETVIAGGYGYRQVLELVQNGADALLEYSDYESPRGDQSRIHVVLHGRRLYVANTGAPLSVDGLDALLRSHSSPKRGNQIGRFGLGFKSLLKLRGQVDLFTRNTGAIRFDPERCRLELQKRFGVTNAPRLRLAWPLGDEERRADPVCTDLTWAETIVRIEIGTDDLVEHIRHEIRTFPAEFLLFFPVTVTLTLDDGKESAREVRLEIKDPEYVLHDGDDVSHWRVAKRSVRIDNPVARDDATHIHAREIMPVTWAVPVKGRREEAGRFWAFFPTHTQTYVPGIINAPWKLNSDRNAVIGGEWNTALMVEAARLIVDTLPNLYMDEDPGRQLDAFPRQLTRKDEDAGPLIEELWALLKTAALIPDATGTLQNPEVLWRHPKDTIDFAEIWQSLAGEDHRRQLVHASCLERQRASRLNVLAERLRHPEENENRPALRRCSAASWFSMVASKKTLEAMQVLRLAEKYAEDSKKHEWSKIRPYLEVIPTQSEELVTAQRAVLAPEDTSVPGREVVDLTLQADSEAWQILTDVLYVNELDDELWRKILNEALKVQVDVDAATDKKWENLWFRLRRSPTQVRKDFIAKNADRICVRRRDGKWVASDLALLPGALVSAEDRSPNGELLVDKDFHAKDGPTLLTIGVAETPQGIIGPAGYKKIAGRSDLLRPWLDACRKRYKDTYDNSALKDYLEPAKFSMPRGWKLLAELKGIAKARLTLHLLSSLHELTFQETVLFKHRSVPSYPKIEVPHPLPWYLQSQGVVEIGSANVSLAAIVTRQDEPVLSQLPDWDSLSFAFDELNKAFPVVEASTDDLRHLWHGMIALLVNEKTLEDDSLTRLWVAAARDGVIPAELPTATGQIAISNVFVTTSLDLARRARSEGRSIVALDEQTMQSWLESGANDLSSLIKVDWVDSAGPPERLLTVLPELEDVLNDAAHETARCRNVVELRLLIEETIQPVPCMLSDWVLHIDFEQLKSFSRVKRIRLLLEEISAAGWLNRSLDDSLRLLGDSHVDERREYIKAGETLAERLLRAVGERPEPLLDALGEALSQMDFIQECSPLRLAELTLAKFGPASLAELKNALNDEGLQPPGRWSSAAALAFVASIGFPPEFASSAQTRREPEELISGPIELPPLHDFQQEVFDGLHELLASNSVRRRSVVSLPTGGGKTRVTVEAVVRLVLAPEGANRSVVWIAQTDELCEQAVQAFHQVWINLGARRTDLRVVRLWGGNPNPAGQELDRPIAVVASIQTLNSRFGSAPLEWLRKPGLVVVDECHHAIASSYSALLRWLDSEKPKKNASDEPPFVGLSATPFRSDDHESHRLARRFDNRWLPTDQERLYSRLRQQGVLAKAYYEPLDSGVGLTEEELTSLERLGEEWEGLDFENLLNRINQRLAGNTIRNERLLKCIKASKERSILFFTNSVAHAEEMVARLNLAGISAAEISGKTPRGARRYFLDRFQRGDIRVLCNHSVLTTGFDAPKTDMILIARQVFSPVRYMQMVGRGLRGEKNGGTASCRIVTVLDNLGRFQDRHPYHYCKKLYAGVA
jgi:superfamily II DNA or RNA helicase